MRPVDGRYLESITLLYQFECAFIPCNFHFRLFVTRYFTLQFITKTKIFLMNSIVLNLPPIHLLLPFQPKFDVSITKA